jgi:hypothetical protein
MIIVFQVAQASIVWAAMTELWTPLGKLQGIGRLFGTAR